MKLVFKKLLTIIIVLFFVEQVFAESFSASYRVELGPLDLGTLKWELKIEKNNYTTSMSLEDRGLMSTLYKFNGSYFAEGRVIDDYFISNKYTQLWETKKKKRNVAMVFKGNKVYSLNLIPEEIESPRINYLEIKNLNDPLTSFMNILLDKKNTHKTIDGRRVYKMAKKSESSTGSVVTKKIIITEYVNIWADHNRNDLKFIQTTQNISDDEYFPILIKIKNKGLIFKLSKI
tara:strand:+ start:159 stop:854 length:696 start_codon:yes stop_codon:yes gene_type:complete